MPDMALAAWITLGVIVVALFLFATEKLPVDVVALLIMLSLTLTGVITPEQGVAGFSNPATLTVAFMFVLSAALLKTGALQVLAHQLADLFKRNYALGMVLMMLLTAAISAFINNTPVVAVFIPVILQIAHTAGLSPTKMLIPLSFASIFGGTCTLVGTSTNILVSGIAESVGVGEIGMFTMLPMGLVLVAAGVLYMTVVGQRLLPKHRGQSDLATEFGIRDYLTELELTPSAVDAGVAIMHAALVRDYDLDVIEVRRGAQRFGLPPGDFVLAAGDTLKVRCDLVKMGELKQAAGVRIAPQAAGERGALRGRNATLVELVILADKGVQGKTLRDLDFRRRYRAVPMAIRHREAVQHEHLYDTPLRAGDVILAEVKTHYIDTLKAQERAQQTPFVVLSERPLLDFHRKKFAVVLATIVAVIALAAFNLLNIMMGAIAGVVLLVLVGVLDMREAYQAINWRIVFLLAGALSLGQAMKNSGLDVLVAESMVGFLGSWGPIAILSGVYLVTSGFTEVMSNNAAAALMAPIAIAVAQSLGVSPMPFLMAVTFSASASFMTPVGYQTNTMVYSAGQYRFLDFVKVGTALNLLFWLLATLLIPVLYPF